MSPAALALQSQEMAPSSRPIQNGIADESTGNNYAHDQPYDRHRAGRDGSFPEAGTLGVWTKADSVTLFADFTYQPQ